MNQPITLLVEDNRDDEELILRELESFNFSNRIIVVRDGKSALDYIFRQGEYARRSHKDDPQVILLDLGLPKVHGLKVLDKIRSDDRTILLPVIVLTSVREDEDIIKSYEHGANCVVRKPIQAEDFFEATRNLGMSWVVYNQLPWG